MNNLYVNDVVEDLKDKISKIESFLVTDDNIEKIENVKKRAIDILNNAIKTLRNSDVNEDEFEEGLLIVKEKSNQLYDEVMKKLKQSNNEEEVKEEASDEVDELSTSCIKVLKEWLSEGEQI